MCRSRVRTGAKQEAAAVESGGGLYTGRLAWSALQSHFLLLLQRPKEIRWRI